MTPQVQRTFQFHANHVLANAEDWQISDTSGSNIEIVFQRDVLQPPRPQTYEVTKQNELRPTGDPDEPQAILTEILCSVRLRPDQAYDLAEDLIRHLQQVRPVATAEGDPHAAD